MMPVLALYCFHYPVRDEEFLTLGDAGFLEKTFSYKEHNVFFCRGVCDIKQLRCNSNGYNWCFKQVIN